MKIKTVTITGADDSIDAHELYHIWKDYPFVEWGILFSTKWASYPRFPSKIWLWKFRDVQAACVPTCQHLCGQYARTFLSGTPIKGPWFDDFCRLQLNFHATRLHIGWDRLIENSFSWDKPIIMQMDGVNEAVYEQLLKHYPAVFPLFDLSGGTGVVPEEWPKMVAPYCGYAGGLGPSNLADELSRIEQAVGDAEIWIDMETHVRSDDNRLFDLDKVKVCLEVAGKYVNSEARS